MLEVKSAISSIYTVAKLIYDQVQLVKANQAQCERLSERIKIIEQAVRGLDKIKEKNNYQKGLNELLNVLKSSLSFIQQFTESKTWFKYILKTSDYYDQFQNLNENLQRCLQQLNLGLVAQQIINREQDKKDQKADHDYILRNQERILQLNEEANNGIQNLNIQYQVGHQAILQQLDSLKNRFNTFIGNNPFPQPTVRIEKIEELRPASPSGEDYYNQGIKYEQDKDYTKAKNAYQRSAQKGYYKAETNIGLFFLKGINGSAPDKQKAYEYFLKAAQQNHVRAMINVATMLEYGDGVPKNITEALAWYKKAFEYGDPRAQAKYEKLLAVSMPVYPNFDASFKK